MVKTRAQHSSTPLLHSPILPHPQGSTGICSHLFAPIIFSGSMRASTSSEIASRSANGLPSGFVQSKPAFAVTLRSGALGSSGDPFIPGSSTKPRSAWKRVAQLDVADHVCEDQALPVRRLTAVDADGRTAGREDEGAGDVGLERLPFDPQ